METSIKVSVLIITYNQEKYISQAIESALAQKTNFEYEILIGEDCSTDGTREKIEIFFDKFPKIIKPFFRPANIGMINNFVDLYNNARGEYIALLEGDDYWTSSAKLQKQVDFLDAHKEFSVCIHDSLDIWEDGQNTLHNNIAEDKVFTLQDLTRTNFISTATTIFRGGYILPDWFFTVKASDWALHFINAMRGDIYYMNDCMSVYRKHNNGFWSCLSSDEAVLMGIEAMMAIDKGTNYKYHNEFAIGIHEKIKKGNAKELLNLASNNESLMRELKIFLAIPANPGKISVNNISPITQTKVSANDPFLNPLLSIDNIDLYFIRTSIVNFIKNILPEVRGVLLDLGCGEMPYKNYIQTNSNISRYIGIDIENPIYQKHALPDLFWDGKTIPLDNDSVDVVMATELFEHLPDIQSVLNEIKRVLKPGGLMFFTVPFLWPLHDTPYDEYRYTPFALERHFKVAGFSDISIKALGGWNASLAQMLGLWLKRSGLQEDTRKKLSESFFPFYKELLGSDVVPEIYDNGPMVTGFSGTVKKINLDTESKKNSVENTYLEGAENKIKMIIIVYFFPKLSETFILDQIIGLIHQGVELEIWAQAMPEEDLIHPSVQQNNLLSRVKYIQFPPANLIAEEWNEQFLRINKIKICETDLFHVHFGQNFVALQKLFAVIKNPVIVSFHGLDASQYIKQMGKDCYKELFNRADLITTPSFEMQNILIAIGSKIEKMIVHRYGVDTRKFIPKGKDGKKEITILTVARLVEKKGIEYSLKAFAKVKTQNAVYKIIGEGPLENELKKLVTELGIRDKIFFLGPKSKDEIVDEMQKADIYMLTSITASNGDKEGLPVTLIEAQSAGLPVVSTIHAGIPELVVDNLTGFLCQEKDVNCIADKLKLLVNNPELREKFAGKARIKVLEEFNIKKLNTSLVQIYKSVSESIRVNNTSLPKTNFYFCPFCQAESEFLPFGSNQRPGAMCPSCGSLERHRLLWIYLENKLKEKNKKIRVLHVAPEDAIANKLIGFPNIEYIKIDLFSNNVHYQMDIQDLRFQDNHFDIIICNHVLEHVHDDKLALKEFLRVLKPGGQALLQVPIFENLQETIEGNHITDEKERTRLFGQSDHLRAYGKDFINTLKGSGFSEVKQFNYNNINYEYDYKKLRLSEGDILFICSKSNGVLA